LAEIAFAAGYLLKGIYVIPDHLPDIGLADDARDFTASLNETNWSYTAL
jgi:hypothetical protein